MIHVKLVKSFIVFGADDIDAHTDAVMDELLKLESESISDSDLSADLKDCTVEVSIVGHAETFDEAAAIADSAIRTAIHAAGGSTPEWSSVEYTPQHSEAGMVTA